MGLIVAVLVGLIVGLVARFLMPGRDPGGMLTTALLGIAGSVVASYIGRATGVYYEGEVSGFIASVLGAMLLLAVFRMLRGRRR
jgi:uncharacterized membrane protein YeaQ/YmgE (transglycosylase-associated protein family)